MQTDTVVHYQLNTFTMLLYATVEGSHGSRPARKGDNSVLEIVLTRKGVTDYWITFNEFGLTVEGDGGVLLRTGDT